jgi:hypothetical protein
VDFVCVDAPSLAAGSFGWWQLNFRGWQRSVDWLTSPGPTPVANDTVLFNGRNNLGGETR